MSELASESSELRILCSLRRIAHSLEKYSKNLDSDHNITARFATIRHDWQGAAEIAYLQKKLKDASVYFSLIEEWLVAHPTPATVTA